MSIHKERELPVEASYLLSCGAGLAFENAAIGIAETAAVNIFQEFVVRKFTPNHSNQQPAKP